MKEFLRLIAIFRPYWSWAIAGIIVSFISLMANIVLLSISGWFITTMGLAGVAGAAVNYFTPAAIIRACAILRTGGRYIERLISHEATFRLMAEMRSWVYHKIEAMPLAQSSQYHSGDLLARLRGDIDALEGFYINVIVPACVAFLALIVITAVFAWHSPGLALIQFCLLITAGIAIPLLVLFKGRAQSRAIVIKKANLKMQMVDNLQSYAEIKVYGIAASRRTITISQSDELIDAQCSLGMMDGAAQGVNGFLANMGLWCALIIALLLYQQGTIQKADIPMLSLFALASFEAVLPLSLAFQSLEGFLQSARRLFVLDQNQSEEVSPNPLQKNAVFFLHMKNVHFTYPGRPTVLNNFSLSLEKGKITPLIGPSGTGKSSVIHLLARLYRPQSGFITLNGVDYDALSDDAIRQYFSVVPQSPYLFIGTLRSNLQMANPLATQQEIDHACWVAGLEDMISALPKGYDTYVGEGGSTLSGGEIRRLAIARAVLKNAPCLLLDEPTEGLDKQTAQKVKTRLFEWAKDKAVLYITHDQEYADLLETT
jgi:ATP-binding cassette, subfamily C, bacterial CydC